MKNKKLYNKIRAIANSIPIVSPDDIVQKRGLMFRINLRWLRQFTEVVEREILNKKIDLGVFIGDVPKK